jgi:hypothetical protein
MARRSTGRPPATAEAATPAAAPGALPSLVVEDESADPVGDGHSDADRAAALPTTAASKRRSTQSTGPAPARAARLPSRR